jgi:hypothetical protein
MNSYTMSVARQDFVLQPEQATGSPLTVAGVQPAQPISRADILAAGATLEPLNLPIYGIFTPTAFRAFAALAVIIACSEIVNTGSTGG